MLRIRPDRAGVAASLLRPRVDPLVSGVAGPADWWVETLTGFADDGFDTLVLMAVDPAPGQVERLAGKGSRRA